MTDLDDSLSFRDWALAIVATVEDGDAHLSRRQRRRLRMERRAVLESSVRWEAHRAAMASRRHIRCPWWRRFLAVCPAQLCDREPMRYL